MEWLKLDRFEAWHVVILQWRVMLLRIGVGGIRVGRLRQRTDLDDGRLRLRMLVAATSTVSIARVQLDIRIRIFGIRVRMLWVRLDGGVGRPVEMGGRSRDETGHQQWKTRGARAREKDVLLRM